jgi:hypothetical protein
MMNSGTTARKRRPIKPRQTPPELRDVVVSANGGSISQYICSQMTRSFFSNILYMRGVIPSPVTELRNANTSQAFDKPNESATYRRRQNAKMRAIKYILEIESEIATTLSSMDLDTFAIFFGPSQSVPKSAYFLHFPSSSSASSGSNTFSSDQQVLRPFVRALVSHWSGSQLQSDVRSRIFVGIRLRSEAPFTSQRFLLKSKFDAVLKKKSRLRRSHFAVRTSKSFVSLSESDDFFGLRDWYLLRKPMKACTS